MPFLPLCLLLFGQDSTFQIAQWQASPYLPSFLTRPPLRQMAMMSFGSLPGTKPAGESNVQELLVAREAYELGCLISIDLEEIEGFERHFALVKSCYTDYASVLPASESQHQLQGLNLLGLLAQSKIAEFHTGTQSKCRTTSLLLPGVHASLSLSLSERRCPADHAS